MEINFKEVLDGIIHTINSVNLYNTDRVYQVSYKFFENKAQNPSVIPYDVHDPDTPIFSGTLIYLLDGEESDMTVHDRYDLTPAHNYEFARNVFFKKVVTHLLFHAKEDGKRIYEK